MEGLNYEIIILSRRVVEEDILTSIHIEEYEVDARETKLGEEEITRDIPNVPEESLADLDERGIIRMVPKSPATSRLVSPRRVTDDLRFAARHLSARSAREVRDTS